MGIEQHLVGLQQIGAHNEGAAVRQLEVCHLQPRPLPAQHRPVLAPVELKGLARLEHKGHEDATASGVLHTLPVRLPLSDERGHTPVRTLVAEDDEIGVQLLHGALLLAGLAGFDLEPVRQLVGKPVQLARPLRDLELRLHRAGAQVFADGVPR
jgi:hypothetical protein